MPTNNACFLKRLMGMKYISLSICLVKKKYTIYFLFIHCNEYMFNIFHTCSFTWFSFSVYFYLCTGLNMAVLQSTATVVRPKWTGFHQIHLKTYSKHTHIKHWYTCMVHTNLKSNTNLFLWQTITPRYFGFLDANLAVDGNYRSMSITCTK